MLQIIRQFLQDNGMSQTQFGYEWCLGDPAFVTKLEAGRKPREKTEARIKAFIAARTTK